MNQQTEIPDSQESLWNGPAGRAWVDAHDVLDTMFRPFEQYLLQATSTITGDRVLDVGCGTGSTTLAIASRFGPQGRAVGIDLSEPMLTLARARAAAACIPAEFVRADAEFHDFEPGSFDRIVSRFGVMFFNDPVRAFTNLRRAASRGAELCCIAWRGAAENPFMTTAERAAAPLLPRLPARQAGTPGQFAFADSQRVRDILEQAGWAGISIEPLDVVCTLPEPDLIRYLSRLGPVGLMLQQADAATRNAVITTVRAAFEPFVHGADVRFTAACWLLRGSAL